MGNVNRLVVVGVLLLTLVVMCLPSRGAVNPKEFRIGYRASRAPPQVKTPGDGAL
jgi:hypothetical protein